MQSTEIVKYGDNPTKSLKLVNWVVRAALGLGIGAITYTLLPYGVSIVENLLQMTIGLTKVFAIGIPLAMSLSFIWANRTLFKKFRERVSRKLWQKFIYSDPLDYIQGVVIEFKKALDKIQAGVRSLMGVTNELQDEAETLQSEAESLVTKAEYLEKEGNLDDAHLAAYEAELKFKAVESIQSSYLEVTEAINILQEIKQGLSGDIKIMEIDLKDMQLNLRIAGIQKGVAVAMEEALEGSPQEQAMREFAKQAYKQKVASAKARFDAFLDKAKPILEAKRIEKAIQTKQGQEALKSFKNNRNLGRSFRQQIEKLKADNPNLYGKRGRVNIRQFQQKGMTKVNRRPTNSSSSFSNLQ